MLAERLVRPGRIIRRLFTSRSARWLSTALIFATFASVLSAEDHTRIVILKMPAQGSAAVRAMLNEPTKAAKAETMDAVLKLQGVSEIAAFNQAAPWSGKAIKLEKPMGELKIGGIQISELGVKVRLQGSKGDDVVEELLVWEMELPTGAKSYHSLQNFGNQVAVTSGRWQERGSWGNSEESWMLWQFSSMEGSKRKTADGGGKSKSAMFVEMYWFQASTSDLASLGQSKPETREKAFQWLAKRAKLWRECSFRAMPTGKAGWSEAEGKYELQDKEPVAKEDRFSIVGGFTAEGEKAKMEWEIMMSRKGKEVTRNLVSTVTPGVWEFIVIDGLPDANLVACRLSRD